MKSKKTFLIIGSNSFSGSHFVNFLLSKGHKTIGVSRSKEINKIFLPYKENKNLHLFKFYKINLNKDKDVKNLLRIIKKNKIKYIVNFAAQAMVAESWIYPLDYYKTNVLSLVNFTKKLLSLKIETFLHVSTPEVYGNISGLTKENKIYNPSTPYAISRASLDMHLMALFKNYNFPVIFTRAANVYGPGQQLFRIIPKSILSAILKKKIFLHGGGKSSRSFIYITDVAEATYGICLKSKKGKIYHISSEKLISINNLVKKIFKYNKIDHKKFIFITKERPGKDKTYKLSSLLLKKNFKWKPKISLDFGIEKTQDWIVKNINIIKKMSLKYEHKR